jgi:hypothetical protein
MVWNERHRRINTVRLLVALGLINLSEFTIQGLAVDAKGMGGLILIPAGLLHGAALQNRTTMSSSAATKQAAELFHVSLNAFEEEASAPRQSDEDADVMRLRSASAFQDISRITVSTSRLARTNGVEYFAHGLLIGQILHRNVPKTYMRHGPDVP